MTAISDDIMQAKKSGSLEFFLVEKSEQQVKGRMPVTKGMLNPFGTINAGAMIWFADVMASILAVGSTEVGSDGKGFPLAINVNTNLLANQRDGEIYAQATLVRKGRRLVVVRTLVTGMDGRLLAEVSTTHIPVE